MKRFLVLVATLVPVMAAGCSQPQLVVEAAITDESSGERLALGDLPIRLLPYDRDAIFDSLEQAYPTPEPAIPPEVIQTQQAVQDAQNEWRVAEDRWATVRDSLRILSEQTQAMERQGQRATAQYAQLYRQFTALEGEYDGLDRQRSQAFARFDSLQQASLAVTDSLKIERDLWADQAFADFNAVVLQKLRERGEEELADTTNAQGFGRFNVPRGNWWIFSRYTLPYEELYWNIPIQIDSDSAMVTLNRQNAQIRPVL